MADRPLIDTVDPATTDVRAQHDTASPGDDVPQAVRRIIKTLQGYIAERVLISGGNLLNGKPRNTWAASITGAGYVSGRPFVETEFPQGGTDALYTVWGSDAILDGFGGAVISKLPRR